MMQLFCFALFLMEFYTRILKFIKNPTGSKIVKALKEENKIGKLNLLSVGQRSFHGSLLGTLLLRVLLLSQWKGRRSNQYDAVAVPGKEMKQTNRLEDRSAAADCMVPSGDSHPHGILCFRKRLTMDFKPFDALVLSF